jgi:hypothetical protein
MLPLGGHKKQVRLERVVLVNVNIEGREPDLKSPR